MHRFARYVTVVILATIFASSGADARQARNNQARNNQPRNNTAAFAGAYNRASSTDMRKPSDTDPRQQCYADAQKQVSSTNQDLQTVRDFVYRNCAYEHGLRPDGGSPCSEPMGGEQLMKSGGPYVQNGFALANFA